MKREDIRKQDEYQYQLNLKKGKSVILNDDRRNNNMKYAGMLDHLEGCRYALGELTDEPSGLLPITEHRYQELIQQFDNYKQRKLQEGYTEPEQPDSDLFNQFCETLAAVDIYREEVNEVKGRIKEFEDEIEKERESREVLRHGMQAGANLKNGRIHDIDGQLVSYDEDDIPYIDDEKSPFNKLKVSDYRALAKQWKAERIANRKHNREAKQKAAEEGVTPLGLRPEKNPKFPEITKEMKRVKLL